MAINYIEEVIELDSLLFQEKMFDYEFIEYVSFIHKKYIDKKFDLTLEEMEEKFEAMDENKKDFAKHFKLEYSRINDLEYLGVASVKLARSYLEYVQSLPQKKY